MIRVRGVSVYCCNEEMQLIKPGTTDAAGEKHIPVYEVEGGDKVLVRVGSVEHPMTEEHYIEWICIETPKGIQYKGLTAKDKPVACFKLCDGEEIVNVYAFCNQHSLWKQ